MSTPTFDPDGAAVYDGVFGLPTSQDQAKVVLIPVPFDATTSYRGGTAQGRRQFFEATWQVDLHDLETGEPWREGICMLESPADLEESNIEARELAEPIKESGGVDANPRALARVNELSELVSRKVQATYEELAASGKLVGVVGGDHSTPLGAIIGAAKRNPGLGLLHVDAHADLRVAYEGFVQSHASIMHNVLERAPGISKLVQVGVRDFCEAEHNKIQTDNRIQTWFDTDLANATFEGTTFAQLVARIVEPLPKNVWVSFDIDGLEPSLCPSTGTPVPGGLTYQQACFLLRQLVGSGRRIVGFDLCEVTPGADGSGSIDAIVGARMLYKLIGWALKSQRP